MHMYMHKFIAMLGRVHAGLFRRKEEKILYLFFICDYDLRNIYIYIYIYIYISHDFREKKNESRFDSQSKESK